LKAVKSIKLSVSASIYESITIALSTMVICKRRAFARLVLEPLNQRLNKLIVGSKFQGHDGSRAMFQSFWLIGVLILITSYNLFSSQGGDTHPSQTSF
jgi:hypothetical protein